MADKKKPFALRVSPEIMKALEQWAADEFRSLNGQIEYLLNDALKQAGRIKKTMEKIMQIVCLSSYPRNY